MLENMTSMKGGREKLKTLSIDENELLQMSKKSPSN